MMLVSDDIRASNASDKENALECLQNLSSLSTLRYYRNCWGNSSLLFVLSSGSLLLGLFLGSELFLDQALAFFFRELLRIDLFFGRLISTLC